jgi:hypothetical protein
MKQEKQLYKGIINWRGELHTLYTHATTEKEAQRNLCEQLANKLGLKVPSVSGRILNTNAIQIKKEERICEK